MRPGAQHSRNHPLQDLASDAMTGTMQPVPSVHVLLGGFSCTSVSNLNRRASSSRSCCAATEGSTGETFEGTRRYLIQHKPRFIILENVTALAAVGAPWAQMSESHSQLSRLCNLLCAAAISDH